MYVYASVCACAYIYIYVNSPFTTYSDKNLNEDKKNCTSHKVKI